MTQRARWLALAALSGLFFGMLRGQPLLTLLSSAVLIWLLLEQILFSIRIGFDLPRLRLQRTVNGRRDTSGLLWAGRDVSIRLSISVESGRIGPLITLSDVIPENLKVQPGRNQLTLHAPFRNAELNYQARVLAAGELVLPGVRVVLQDAQGFFHCERFLPLPAVFRVLPEFAEAGDTRPIVKRVNALPQHGIHRLQRSGMGSELLELREYVIGDPPKSIAWKISARRDKLMTRQYESEVPVRVQLFVDGSIGTRIGGFGVRLLDQMTFLTASIARAATRVGDPVGAILLDERGLQRIPCTAGERGFYQLMKSLADFSINPVPPPARLTTPLIHAALRMVQERYPELLDDRVNRIPFSLFPVLPWNRRRFHERCMLATVVSHLHSLGIDGQIQLMHDDILMAWHLQQFLNQSGSAWMAPVVEDRRRNEHDGLPRMQQLSDAIVRAVARARDNEVFVIVADLIDCVPAISHLIPAVRMARARHHRVAVVCPSPTFLRPTPESVVPESDRVEDLLLAAEQIRIRNLSLRLQRELGLLGATVAVSGQQNSVRLVLAQMELARTGRFTAAGARR